MRDEQREKSIRNEKILNNIDTVKEVNQLRSPIYFTHIDNVIPSKEYLGEEPNGFVDVPLQQDGFGNLDAKTHIGRVHSIFEPALDQATTIYGMGTKLDEMGFYIDKSGDLLESGINSMVTSVFRKMSADFISLISSVYHNGLYNHIAPFYNGTDNVPNRLHHMIDGMLINECRYLQENIYNIFSSSDEETQARYNVVQAFDQGRLSHVLLQNIATAYHNFIIDILNNFHPENGTFDLKEYVKYITSSKWGDCSNERHPDEFYSFAYATLCEVARKDCFIIADGLRYIIMDNYAYLSKVIYSIQSKDQK